MTKDKKKKKDSVKKKTPSVLKYKSDDIQKKIDQLSSEIKLKDEVIEKFKDHLDLANQVILQLNQEVDSNLEIMHKLHENLLPTQFPSIASCEFSYKFIPSLSGQGKDFYQVIPLQRKNFGILMSSCVSHILSSLLFSSRLRLMEANNSKNLNPQEVILQLAQEIKDKMNGIDNKIDIFYSVLNQKKYSLSYCSVGDIYAFIYSFNSKELYELKSSASYFDIDKIQKCSSEKVILQPRDHLILCSPGVVHGVNKKRKSLGVQRLKEIICDQEEAGAHSLRNHILYKVKSYYDNEPLNRDQSIFVMEVQDKILRLT